MQQTKRQPDEAAMTITTEDYVPDVNLIARIAALGSLAQSVEAVVRRYIRDGNLFRDMQRRGWGCDIESVTGSVSAMRHLSAPRNYL